MLGRSRYSAEVTEAIRQAEEIIPYSGETDDLLVRLSEARGRPIRLLVSPLSEAVSGVLISTEKADYIAVSEGASPERQVAIVCHEVAHVLLGHDHQGSLTSSLVDTGLLSGLDPKLVSAVVAGRQAHAETVEIDAELVATYISVELRKRIMRGGHTHFDDRWQ